MRHCTLVIVIILSSGVFGGIVNFLQGYEGTDRKVLFFLKNIVLGMAASLLVPLFLDTISSNLIDQETMRGYLTFTGFCLIASIFSRRFIDTLGEKILQKAKEAEIKAEKALVKSNKNEDKVDAIIELSSDGQISNELSYDKLQSQLQSKIEKDQYRIIDSMLNKDFRFRTIAGIGEELNISPDIVAGVMNELQKGNIVRRIENRKGQTLWSITYGGRRAYEKIMKERNEKK